MAIAFDYRPTRFANPAEQCLALLQPLQDCLLRRVLGHDLPNSLVAIQGLARLLLLEQAERLDEEGRLHLNRLLANARQANELVRDLADLGELLRDPGPVEPIDLAEVVQEAAASVKVLCPGRWIEYHLNQPLPRLTMAHRPWLQVLVLLFRGLAERSAGGGPCRICIRGEETSEGAQVVVEAPELRLAEEDLARLFEPYAPGSRGLQWFPVRLIVAHWAGRLQIDSSVASGTCFRLQVAAGNEPAATLS